MNMIFPVALARSQPVTLGNLLMRKLIEEIVFAILLCGILKQVKFESHTNPIRKTSHEKTRTSS